MCVCITARLSLSTAMSSSSSSSNIYSSRGVFGARTMRTTTIRELIYNIRAARPAGGYIYYYNNAPFCIGIT